MASKKAPFTFESNTEKISQKISEVPGNVMKVIAQNLIREIKANELKTQFNNRTKILSKALQWAWDYDAGTGKNKAGVQIGFKASIQKNKAGAGPGFVGDIMTGQMADPIKPSVIRNKDMIVDTIAKAIQEITKK